MKEENELYQNAPAEPWRKAVSEYYSEFSYYTCNYYNFEYNIDIDISEVRHAKIR